MSTAARTTSIPRVLHQIWLGKGEMPLNQRRWRRRFAEMNPHWEMRLWTDDNLPPILNRNAWDACGNVGGTPGCVMRSDILRLELLARFGGVYLDTDVKPIRPLDEMCPPEVAAWAACEQLDIVSNAAMGFPPNHPAMWHAVAMVEESFFERRYVGDQAGPGLIARVVTQYDDVALYPPAYFHPTVGESQSNPDAPAFLKASHLFAGTWVADNRIRYHRLWKSNQNTNSRASGFPKGIACTSGWPVSHMLYSIDGSCCSRSSSRLFGPHSAAARPPWSHSG